MVFEQKIPGFVPGILIICLERRCVWQALESH